MLYLYVLPFFSFLFLILLIYFDLFLCIRYSHRCWGRSGCCRYCCCCCHFWFVPNNSMPQIKKKNVIFFQSWRDKLCGVRARVVISYTLQSHIHRSIRYDNGISGEKKNYSTAAVNSIFDSHQLNCQRRTDWHLFDALEIDWTRRSPGISNSMGSSWMMRENPFNVHNASRVLVNIESDPVDHWKSVCECITMIGITLGIRTVEWQVNCSRNSDRMSESYEGIIKNRTESRVISRMFVPLRRMSLPHWHDV